MNEEAAAAPQERSTMLARFHNRLHRYKNLLLARWWILVLCAGLGLGLAYFLIQRTPPSFVSVGRMILNTKIVRPNSDAYAEDWNSLLGTHAAMMQSDSVANRAAVRLQTLKPDLHPVKMALKVSVSPKTSIFNLVAQGGDADYTHEYLDAIMEEYINIKRELRQRASDTAKFGIQEELLHLNQQLQQTKLALENYASTNPVVFLQEAGNSAGAQLATRTRQLADLRSELQLLKMLTLDQNLERQVFQQNPPANSPGAQQPKPDGAVPELNNGATAEKNSSNLYGSDSEYLKAKQQILLLKTQREEFGQVLRPKHPKMIALDEDIASKEKLLEIFRQQSQEQLGNRQHAIEIQIQNLEGEIKGWEQRSLEISKKMSDFQSLKENLVRLQNMYDRLMGTEHSLEVDKELSPEGVTIFEPATMAVPVRPQTLRNLIIACVLGLGLGIGVLALLDYLDDRPSSFTELQDMFDETILGQIPQAAATSKNKLVPIIQEEDDRHALVEAYRNLRSSIIFLGASAEHPKVLLLTSAIPGDGKSMTSANLAVTMARAGSRVLLVDADLRRGVMHKHFSVPVSPGLAEVLEEQLPWSQAAVQTSVPNLHLIPRGNIPRNPGELFVRPSKDKLLKELAGQYDYLLFDTAPVMAADDVSNLAPFMDGVILVIRARYTSGRVARAALDLLYMRKVNVIGLVFNAVEAEASEYYYYKYKEYYARTPAE